MSKILTSHVGSLPRTQQVVDFIFSREDKTPYDPAGFDAAMTKTVFATVAKQVTAGVDIFSDGETSKISYATYVKDRYTGFDSYSPRHGHEWAVFRDRARDIPDGKILVPSVVDLDIAYAKLAALSAGALQVK